MAIPSFVPPHNLRLPRSGFVPSLAMTTDGLITEQSFVAKSSDPWIKQIDYFSSIGSGEMSVGVVPITVNLKHRRMQKVMKDVWNVYLESRSVNRGGFVDESFKIIAIYF